MNKKSNGILFPQFSNFVPIRFHEMPWTFQNVYDKLKVQICLEVKKPREMVFCYQNFSDLL